MSSQLIRPGEFPPATFPTAKVRFFAGMGPMMGFEVTGFGISLEATFIGTSMNGDFFLTPPSSTPFLKGYSGWGRIVGGGGGNNSRGIG